jgi:transposase
VSLEACSLCLVDREGRIRREGKVAGEPEAILLWLAAAQNVPERVGLEAGPLPRWLRAGLTKAGLAVTLLETRHVKAALSAMAIKTDRNDARGSARLLRLGWFKPVPAKALPAQEGRALLTARKLLVDKVRDLENSLRGLLRNCGLKARPIGKAGLAGRIRALVAGQPAQQAPAPSPQGRASADARGAMLALITGPFLEAREALRRELAVLHRAVMRLARGCSLCRRLMTAPGVGVVVALTFKSTIDDPARLARSRDVGPYLGLVPRRDQSGETDYVGSITRIGDAMLRTALYEAAPAMLRMNGAAVHRRSALRAWVLRLAERAGARKARVAPSMPPPRHRSASRTGSTAAPSLARKLGLVLHRMWASESVLRCEAAVPA